MDKQMIEIVEKLKDAENTEEIISICKEYGVDLSPEEAEKGLALLNSQNEELSLEALEGVAGGGIVDTIKEWFGSLFGK